MTTLQDSSGARNNQNKWSRKFGGKEPDSKQSYSSTTAGKYRFWKRGTNKTPGAIKQVRGAQYPPIMDKNQMNTFTKNTKKRHSATITINSSSQKSSDSYLNYEKNNYTSNILINNHHDVAIHNKNNKVNNIHNDNNNNNMIQVGYNNTVSLPYPQYPQSRILEKDKQQQAQQKLNFVSKDTNSLPDSIPLDFSQLIQSAKNDRERQSQSQIKQKSKPKTNTQSQQKISNNNNNIDNNNHQTNQNVTVTQNGTSIHMNDTNNTQNNTNNDDSDQKFDNSNEPLDIQNGNHMNGNVKSLKKNRNSKLKEWDEIKNESDAQKRKNLNRTRLLTKMIDKPMLDANAMRKACWRGVPRDMRPTVWKLLLGYTPKNRSRRESTLKRKREEYYNLVERYYTHTQREHRSDQENQIVHQISLDVPRTSPELKLFQIPNIAKLLSRALYIWSHRHTATGYVQGINDLITPFVYIFLDELLKNEFNICLDSMKSREYIGTISDRLLLSVEADSYWCLDYLIEGLQLNYTDGQPGIQNMIQQLEEVIERVNQPLSKHFKHERIEFIQFSFRWMNCLLMRELSLHRIIRLWDTYLCEGVELSAGFSEFHVFVCAALLLCFADDLMKNDFAQIMLFIQALLEKTENWGEREIETILSEAYVYQQLFGKTKKSLYN